MEFDLSKIKVSNPDIKRGLVLPKNPSKELAEFIGIVIGDGYLYNNKRKYTIGIVGNPKTDLEYFLKIQKLVSELFNIKTKIKTVGRGLRLIFGSKGVFYFLTIIIGLDYGAGKCKKTKIPSIIFENDKLTNSVIRGIFDTDGTIFTSYKKGAPNYPCIELTTTSLGLAKQVRSLLIKKGFRVASIRGYKYTNGKLLSYKVSLYGKKNMELWSKKINFSNPLKYNKLLRIINGDAGI